VPIKLTSRLSLAILCSAVLCALASEGRAGSITIGGAGVGNDCGKRLEWKKTDKASYAEMVQWEMGYLSGAAVFGPRKVSPLKGMVMDEVTRRFDNYCQNHLEQTIQEVADYFIKQHQN
jgi:hypothetical protein